MFFFNISASSRWAAISFWCFRLKSGDSCAQENEQVTYLDLDIEIQARPSDSSACLFMTFCSIGSVFKKCPSANAMLKSYRWLLISAVRSFASGVYKKSSALPYASWWYNNEMKKKWKHQRWSTLGFPRSSCLMLLSKRARWLLLKLCSCSPVKDNSQRKSRTILCFFQPTNLAKCDDK